MNFTIREFEQDDALAIYLLNKDVLGYDYAPNKTQVKLDKISRSHKDRIFVALIENVVIGYIHAVDYDVIYAPHLKNIMSIAVDEDFQKCGIGTLLINYVEDWAKETGAYGVRLNSNVSRNDTREFYLKCGFRFSAEHLDYKKMFN